MEVYHADRLGRSDSAYHTLVRHINSPLPIVMVSWAENFEFNAELLNIKDYVLVCFCEYGHDFEIVDSHIWGVNSEKFQRYYNNDWVKFDNWVKENPPKVLLKRELLKKDVTVKVKPIEYPVIVDIPELQTKEQYYARPINVFHFWGRSSERRVKAHADFWARSGDTGASICDNIFYLQNFLSGETSNNKWVTLNIPHYSRIDISQILVINGMSKLSLSMGGAGNKCFRHGESSTNSVMVMEENDVAWTFPWLSGINCLGYGEGIYNNDPMEVIDNALRHYTYEVLYKIYCAGVENAKKYQVEPYVKHIESIINKAV